MPMSEKGRAVWRSPEGLRLLDKWLSGQPAQEEDQPTLKELRRLSRVQEQMERGKRRKGG